MSLRRTAVYAVGTVLHASGAFRLLHRHMLPDTVSVLMYHGLVSTQLPVSDWCFLSVRQFELQVEYINRHFDVMHLEDAFAPDRPPAGRPIACVTFDDGFASVHSLALPVLERFRIPATVYLVTDLVDAPETVWFARLHQAMSETTASEVVVRGLRFTLRGSVARAEASAGVQRALKPLARPDFGEAFEDVLDQLGSGGPRRASPWEAFRILRSHEIRRMSRDDLVRFGGHTATHQILTRTTREDARHEIERSVAAVSALVKSPSRTFAYPNGGPDDFDEGVIDNLRGVGVTHAVTTMEGPNPHDVDPFRIRRCNVDAADPLARVAGLAHHARDALKALVHGAWKS